MSAPPFQSTQGAPAFAANKNPLSLIPSATSPTFANAGEPNLFLAADGTTWVCIYRVNETTTLHRTTATNGLIDNWTTPTVLALSGYFPTTFKDPTSGNLYMLLSNSISGGAETTIKIYQSMDDGQTWTVKNGGNPVLSGTDDTSSYWWYLFNPAACIDNSGTIHLLQEAQGTVSSSFGGYNDVSSLAYCSGTLAQLASNSLTFTMPPYPTIPNGCNGDLHWVQDRSALVAIHGDTFPGYQIIPSEYLPNQTPLRLKVSWAYIASSNDLTQDYNWRQSGFPWNNKSGAITYEPGDPVFVFTPGKTYPCILMYNDLQQNVYTQYLPGVSTIDQFFNLFCDPAPPSNAAMMQLVGEMVYSFLRRYPIGWQTQQTFPQVNIVGPTYPALNVGTGEITEDVRTNYGSVVWDQANQQLVINTAANGFPIVLNGSTIVLGAVGGTTTVSVPAETTGGLNVIGSTDPHLPQIQVGLTLSACGQFYWYEGGAYFGTTSNSYPINLAGSAINVRRAALPSSDPHAVGQCWLNGNVLTVSNG